MCHSLYSWVLYLLAAYPEEQQRAYEDCLAATQEHPSQDEEEGFDEDGERDEEERQRLAEQLGKMTYLSAVIKEALRLFPAIPMLSRRFVDTSSPTELGGFAIPPGNRGCVADWQSNDLTV